MGASYAELTMFLEQFLALRVGGEEIGLPARFRLYVATWRHGSHPQADEHEQQTAAFAATGREAPTSLTVLVEHRALMLWVDGSWAIPGAGY